MKEAVTRSMEPGERVRLEGFLDPGPARGPGKLLGFSLALPIAYTAFLAFNIALPVPFAVRVLLAVAVGWAATWFFGRWITARHAAMFRPAPEVESALRADLASGRVAVTRYDVEAAVKVAADPRRFVATTWLLKLAGGSVILLSGPHLDEAEEAGSFPATSFEIATGESSHFVLAVRRTGEHLTPVGTRAPLSDAEWEEIGEGDDETVPLTWAGVLDAAGRNPHVETRMQKARPASPAPAGSGPVPSTPPPGEVPAEPIRPK